MRGKSHPTLVFAADQKHPPPFDNNSHHFAGIAVVSADRKPLHAGSFCAPRWLIPWIENVSTLVVSTDRKGLNDGCFRGSKTAPRWSFPRITETRTKSCPTLVYSVNRKRLHAGCFHGSKTSKRWLFPRIKNVSVHFSTMANNSKNRLDRFNIFKSPIDNNRYSLNRIFIP